MLIAECEQRPQRILAYYVYVKSLINFIKCSRCTCFFCKKMEYMHISLHEEHNMLCFNNEQTSDKPDLHQQVLRTDVSGMPLEWINYGDAVRLICLERVAYSLGGIIYTLRGGINSRTGQQSLLSVNAILATRGRHPISHLFSKDYSPPLSNRALFKRDQNLCLYCGQRFMDRDLSRDHVNPVSQNGIDTWRNVVTACKRCNNHKAGRTPEQASMKLLAIPFVPTHAEYIYLQGRRILADQMEFLLTHFPRNSLLRERVATAAARSLE